MANKKNQQQNTSKISYSDIADYFIAISNESGDSITNLKLQKLVYYAQAWYLANFNKPLFKEDFEAWIHGPVIPSLYDEYKKLGPNPIKKDINLKEVRAKIDKKVLEFLDEVVKVYMPCGAYQLEMMTHREDPWIIARGGCTPDERCNNIIDKDQIQKYYGQKIKSQTNRSRI